MQGSMRDLMSAAIQLIIPESYDDLWRPPFDSDRLFTIDFLPEWAYLSTHYLDQVFVGNSSSNGLNERITLLRLDFFEPDNLINIIKGILMVVTSPRMVEVIFMLTKYAFFIVFWTLHIFRDAFHRMIVNLGICNSLSDASQVFDRQFKLIYEFTITESTLEHQWYIPHFRWTDRHIISWLDDM